MTLSAEQVHQDIFKCFQLRFRESLQLEIKPEKLFFATFKAFIATFIELSYTRALLILLKLGDPRGDEFLAQLLLYRELLNISFEDRCFDPVRHHSLPLRSDVKNTLSYYSFPFAVESDQQDMNLTRNYPPTSLSISPLSAI